MRLVFKWQEIYFLTCSEKIKPDWIFIWIMLIRDDLDIPQ